MIRIHEHTQADIEADQAANDAAYEGRWADFMEVDKYDTGPGSEHEGLSEIIQDEHIRREEEAERAQIEADYADIFEEDAMTVLIEQPSRIDTDRMLDDEDDGFDESGPEDPEDVGDRGLPRRIVRPIFTDKEDEDPLAGDVERTGGTYEEPQHPHDAHLENVMRQHGDFTG